MYPDKGVNSCGDIVEHNPGAFRKSLQLAHGRWLDDIERSKKYKTREKRFPCERDGDERDQLPGDFIDDDKLRVFCAASARNLGGRGYPNQRDEDCQASDDWRSKRGRQGMGDGGPQHNRYG
jgi:hypothetical protein